MKTIEHKYPIGLHKGFTLLELMVVLVIVAILAVIAIPSYNAYTVRSQRAAAEAQMQRIAGELYTFRAKNLSYTNFDPTYLYGVAGVDTTKSIITLPVGAIGKNIQYTLVIWDVSTPATPVALSSGLGRQWAITGTINMANSFSVVNYNLLLTSSGMKCMTKNTISAPYADCGMGSIDW